MRRPEASIRAGDRPTVIRPSKSWRAIDIRELWRFRSVLIALGQRDVKLRYRQTALGATWVVAQPLLGAGIFTLVFDRVAGLSSEGIPYFVFAFAGLVAWNAFSETVARTSSSLVTNQSMIAKIYFPRLLLPLSSGVATIVNFVIGAVVLVALIAANGLDVRVQLLALPALFAILLLLALGLGLIATALNVFYRDVGYIVPVAIQMLLYASPVAYGVEQVPDELRWYLSVNPLTGLLEAFRAVAFGTDLPTWELAWSVAAALIIFVVGALVFRRMERRFADVI